MSSKNARKDPAWKYGKEEELPSEAGKKGYKYLKCNFCSKIVKGGVTRMKDHLAGTHKDVTPCPSVPADVKDEITQYLKSFQDMKFSKQRNFEESVGSGAYYSGGSVNSDRGVRGPMDQMIDRLAGSSKGGEEGTEKVTPVSAKEHRNQVCLDIGRFFYENGIPFHVASSPSFASMLRSVGNFGRGLKAPTMHELRTWILKEEVKTTSLMVSKRRQWGLYMELWISAKKKLQKTWMTIIDQKWENQMHRDLHAAAYYLNPQYRWSPDVSEHPEIKRGLYDVMDRLVKDTSVYLKIEQQLIDYKEKRGLFGYRGSLATYKTRPPVTWWGEYGDETPELKAFAIKVLGLTCSASACERNWSTFNQVHTKRRNRLNTERMNNLVYVVYNRKLKQKFLRKTTLKEEDDPLVVENVMSDDEWIAHPNEDNEDVESGGAASGEEDGETTRAEGGEASGSRTARKRKRVQINLIDEESEDDSGHEDHYLGDDANYVI